MTQKMDDAIKAALASTAPLLTAEQAAPLLGCSASSLRLAMRDHPEWLPPGTVLRTSATRCRIVREVLLQALGLYPGASPPEAGDGENNNIAAGGTNTCGDVNPRS